MALSSRRFVRMLGLAAVTLVPSAQSVRSQAAPDSRVAAKDPYVEAAGLRPLRDEILPAGTREIRAWVGGGLGWPQELFRLLERGGRMSGEYIRYWQLDNRDPPAPDSMTFAALVRYHERGRCGPVRRGANAEACRAQFRREPDWSAVWRAADSLDIWTLPDASTLPEVVGPNGERIISLDGWGITVELRDGPSYRLWHYANPDRKPWPEAARATAFAGALRSVSALTLPSAEQRVYVGRVDVRADTLEFSPCAGGGPWLLTGRISPLTSRREGSGPNVSTSRVDVRGTLAPQWITRDWWHVPARYQRTLEVDSVMAVSPWRSDACR